MCKFHFSFSWYFVRKCPNAHKTLFGSMAKEENEGQVHKQIDCNAYYTIPSQCVIARNNNIKVFYYNDVSNIETHK